MKKMHLIRLSIVILGFYALFLAGGVKAVSINDIIVFNVDAKHSIDDSSKVQARLVKLNSKLLFYVDDKWWQGQSYSKQTNILSGFDVLSAEFENRIYPTLTSLYGTEAKPGIDGDERIIVLFHSMKKDLGGYFRSADEQPREQITDSNQHEMVYLPLDKIDSDQLKVLLAHEFTHLITYNQKTKNFGIDEDIWLNEGRAEYSSEILGYDDNYQGSNLQRRVNTFLSKITEPITEWQDTEYDYGAVNIFLHYLVDQYGVNILADSLKSKYIGIESINYALEKNGSKENFGQVFTNWTIATLINDCSQNNKYCYKDANLAKIKISPTLNFLPLSGTSSLSVTNIIKSWSGNWQKVIGGKGNLRLKFSGLLNTNFKVPYVVYAKDGTYSINFIALDKNQEGVIDVPNFGIDNMSLVIMPTLQNKNSSLGGVEFGYPYTFTVSIQDQSSISEDQELIARLLARIEELKAQIAAILASRSKCSSITVDLYYGMNNNAQVSCLQNFLKVQGVAIYPEGLVTGNFGNLTMQAVTRFQKKYNLVADGKVTQITRNIINQLIKQ